MVVAGAHTFFAANFVFDQWEQHEPVDGFLGPPSFRSSDISIAQENALGVELFGPGITASHVREVSDGLWQTLLWQWSTDQEMPLDGPREYLRTMMIEARGSADREQLLAMDRLYLAWLRQADSEEACREVTGRSFFDGVPHMSEGALVEERRIARQLLDAGLLAWRNPQERDYAIPEDMIAQAEAQTELSAAQIQAAMADHADPRRCAATIALLQAALAEPSEASHSLLAGL